MTDDLRAVLDARTVLIRPITPSDGDALVRFHEGLTDETTRMRFFRLHRHLTPREIEQFTHVDHHDREALVALDGLEIIAVGRFERLPGTQDAEVAFVVADGWQGHGAGTNLLAQLARGARKEGVSRFVADTLGENHRMIAIFRHSGLIVESNIEAGVVHVVLSLEVEPIAQVPGPRDEVAGVNEGQTALLEALEELRAGCLRAEDEFRHAIAEVMPSNRASARNLVHYVALRRLDLRVVQEDLARLGLSSLGRSEAHVMGSLDVVIGILARFNGCGGGPARLSESVEAHSQCLERNADRLLGSLASDRATRVMVTLPSDAARGPEVATELVRAGMDIARINCAHDTPTEWRAMARHVRTAAAAQDRACRIAMDLAGPKLRTGPLPLGPPVVRVAPERDRRGIVLAPARLWLSDDPGNEALQEERTEVPVCPNGVLSRCRAGDVIRLRDAWNAKRELHVVEVQPGRVFVETRETTYLETGLELRLPADGARVTATIGPLPRSEPGLRLHVGDELTLTRVPDAPESAAAGELRVSCTLPEVFDHARAGDRVWFDDGKIGAVVRECGKDELSLQIIDARPGGSRLRASKGINLPDTDLPISALTAEDESDLTTAVELADIIDVSFVRSAADVAFVQERVAALGGEHIGLVLKIETVAGFEHLPEVLLAAMRTERIGVMIARGDLAVEAGYERMAEVQEEILWLCESANVPVIWATQVLDQLARTGRPSRAEVTDAALAARAECIMLNKGPHIVAAIATLLDINRRMRDHQYKKQSLLRRLRAWDHDREP